MTIDTSTTRPSRTWVGTNTLVPIALGAMHMGTRTPELEARRILDHYLSEVTPRYTGADGTPALAMIDTADCYCWWEDPNSDGGHSEAVLGRWMADTGTRDQVLLASKASARIAGYENAWKDGEIDWDYTHKHFTGASGPVLRESLAGSLERLGTDRLDLFYIHVDDYATPLEETLATLAELIAEGIIGAYGWSNVRTWRMAKIRVLCEANGWPQPVALQQQHSYLRRRAGLDNSSIVDDEQLDYLKHHSDLNLVSYSPIVRGAFSAPERRDPEFGLMANYAGPDAVARFAAIDEVAAQTGATGNQVALQWMVAQTQPAALPLIGPRTFHQYLECIEALDVELTEEQMQLLNSAGA